MKPAKLTLLILITLACILLLPMALGTLVYDFIIPADHFETTGTSVLFNWTTNSTSLIDNPMPAYLFITTNLSDENQFFLNYTKRYCLNYSYQTSNNTCDTTVTGFLPGYYQWKVVTGESAVAPTTNGTNVYPFDTRDRAANVTSINTGLYDTSDRAANVTSSNAQTYNTSDRPGTLTSTAGGTTYNTSTGNISILNMYYSINSSNREVCNVTLEQNEALPVANVTASINSACNLTVVGTGNFTITTKSEGATEFIYISDGNATVTLGLSNLTNYTGSVNNTLNFRYTNTSSGTEVCNATLSKSNALDVLDAITSITDGCNLTGTIKNSYLNLNTNANGVSEFIYFDASTANSILGFTEYINYSGTINNTLNFRYTNTSSGTEVCNVTFTKNATLLRSEAITTITDGCNLTGTDVSYINLNTNATGASEFIYFDASTVQGILGFTIGFNYTGSVNNTLDLTYSVNGSSETCNVSLNKDSQWNATDVITNMTQGSNQCNLTLTNTTFLILNGSGYGEEEYITIASGSALGILGLAVGTTYGSQINTTSDLSWLQVREAGTVAGNYTFFTWLNDSGFLGMTLNKDTGDLWIAGVLNFSGEVISYASNLFTFGNNVLVEGDVNITGVFNGNISSENVKDTPSLCTTNFAQIGSGPDNFSVSTCADYWFNPGENITEVETINLTERSAAPGVTSVGMMYYDSDLNELCFYNSTAWIGVITHGACT